MYCAVCVAVTAIVVCMRHYAAVKDDIIKVAQRYRRRKKTQTIDVVS